MARYENGFVPRSALIKFDEGEDDYGHWEHLLPWHTLYALRKLQLIAKARTGHFPDPSAGYSCYRPYAFQVLYRKINGVWAAWPGTSSHGGEFNGDDSMAVDLHNWFLVYQRYAEEHGYSSARIPFYEDVRAAGLTPGVISPSNGFPDEPWHVVDFNPWEAAPTDDGDIPFPYEEDDMFSDADREMLRQVWQDLLPGQEGVKTQGKTNKVFTDTLLNTRQIYGVANEGKVASQSLVADFQQGQAGVQHAGRLLVLLDKAAAGTAVTVDIALLAKEIAEQIEVPVGSGATPEQVQEIVTKALAALVLRTDI